MIATQFSIRKLLRERLAASGEPDWERVAVDVVADLPDEHLRDALRQSLPLLAREEARRSRNASLAPGAHSRKWAEVAALAQTGIFHERIWVDGEHKFLGDLTRGDVVWVVEDYTRRAVETAAKADRFKRLEGVMRDCGVPTVADLGESRVEEIFNA